MYTYMLAQTVTFKEYEQMVVMSQNYQKFARQIFINNNSNYNKEKSMKEQHTEFPDSKLRMRALRQSICEQSVQPRHSEYRWFSLGMHSEWFGAYILHSECSIELHSEWNSGYQKLHSEWKRKLVFMPDSYCTYHVLLLDQFSRKSVKLYSRISPIISPHNSWLVMFLLHAYLKSCATIILSFTEIL